MRRGFGPALNAQAQRPEIVTQAQSQWFHLTGEITINDVGAATVDVLFPVYFVEKPRFSFGSELAPGEPYEDGNMPTCTVTVLSWDQRRRDDTTIIYGGATLCVVTSGLSGQNMIAFWHMEGIGIRPPESS